jgi:outer membrane immunogenic protein
MSVSTAEAGPAARAGISWGPRLKAVMTPQAALWADRSAIAGRPAHSCWAWKRRGNWANFSGDNVSLLFPTVRNHTSIDSFGLFTGQVGYSWSNALLYLKGGAAVVNDQYRILGNTTGTLLGSTDETRWGGTLGVGFEYGFMPNWSVAVEYDHLFLGSNTNTFVTPAGLFSDNIRQDLDIFTARVNYRFGGPAVPR